MESTKLYGNSIRQIVSNQLNLLLKFYGALYCVKWIDDATVRWCVCAFDDAMAMASTKIQLGNAHLLGESSIVKVMAFCSQVSYNPIKLNERKQSE